MLLPARDAATFRKLYGSLATANPLWARFTAPRARSMAGPRQLHCQPPFFDGFSVTAVPPPTSGARAVLVRDSITTDHISPAGAIKVDFREVAAGQQGAKVDFNSWARAAAMKS
jgi:aconitate hydratase